VETGVAARGDLDAVAVAAAAASSIMERPCLSIRSQMAEPAYFVSGAWEGIEYAAGELLDAALLII
jgi:hypothetical protein